MNQQFSDYVPAFCRFILPMLLTAFILFPTVIKGQEVMSIVDADTLRPGDVVEYILVTKKTEQSQTTILPDSAAFGEDFEIRSFTQYRPDDYTDSLVYELQYFGVGANQLPGLDVQIATEEADTLVRSTSPVPLSYKTLVDDPSKEDALQPLKDIYDFAAAIWPWIIAVLVIAALIGWYLYWRKNQPEQEEFVPKTFETEPFQNPITRLRQSIVEVSDSDALQKGDFKTFYSDLGDAIRAYFEDAYQIEALEMTSRELIRALHQKAVDDRLIESANAVLKQADMVKFAKYTPTLDAAYQDLDKGKEFLKTVSEIDGPRIERLKKQHEEKNRRAREAFQKAEDERYQSFEKNTNTEGNA